LDLDGRGALFEQLARALKRAILDGRLLANGRLPSTRFLAMRLGVSRNTVLGAYELLCAEQLAVAVPGSGTRVTATTRPPAKIPTKVLVSSKARAPSRYAARARRLGPGTLARAGRDLRYNLQYGEPLMSAPLFQAWRRKLAAAALSAGPGYPRPGGYLPLRAVICDYLARRRGVTCAEEDVLIVGGTQQAFTLAARVLLDEGDAVVLEDPHYEMALGTLRAHGARIVSTRVDAQGLVVHELPPRGPRLICVTPSHQFPSGEVMSFARRVELLDYAARQDSWILEDDYDSEFRYEGRPLPALRSLDLADRVIYVGSFSKTLFPSLRLAYMVCPAAIREDLFRAKRLDDLGSPAIDQAALAAFLRGRRFEKHLLKSISELRRRRQTLLEGLNGHIGTSIKIAGAAAGMHVVAWLRRLDYAGLSRLIAMAAERDLGLHPIHPYYRTPPLCPGLLLGFAGLPIAQLEKATALLSQCLTEVESTWPLSPQILALRANLGM
jgi:GntR family transcriptional regulator/MocR family aminotransferase